MNTQMELIEPARGRLGYNGVAIRDKGEMLSLTDMWKAGGSDPSKRPYEWSRKEGAAFVEAVSISLNTPVGRIYKAERGKGGSTFAHWQIGLAYAKYLSPEFHIWCNSVVRAHMEGKAASGIANLPRDVLDMIERSFGINRMLAHKVTELERMVTQMQGETLDARVSAKLAENALLLRRGKTAKQIWDAAGLPPKIKGATNWFGNRLKEGGCMLQGRAARGD